MVLGLADGVGEDNVFLSLWSGCSRLAPFLEYRLGHIFPKSHLMRCDFPKGADNIFVLIVYQSRCTTMKLAISACSEMNQGELVRHMFEAIFYGHAGHGQSPWIFQFLGILSDKCVNMVRSTAFVNLQYAVVEGL